MAGERTSPIPIRLTIDERARLAALLAHFPELASFSDVLRQALTLGTLLMAVQATRPGQAMPYAGYTPDDLAALLMPRLLPALAFLHAQGALTQGMPSLPGVIDETLGRNTVRDQGAEPTATDNTHRYINQDAADELAAIGTDFLD